MGTLGEIGREDPAHRVPSPRLRGEDEGPGVRGSGSLPARRREPTRAQPSRALGRRRARGRGSAGCAEARGAGHSRGTGRRDSQPDSRSCEIKVITARGRAYLLWAGAGARIPGLLTRGWEEGRRRDGGRGFRPGCRVSAGQEDRVLWLECGRGGGPLRDERTGVGWESLKGAAREPYRGAGVSFFP